MNDFQRLCAVAGYHCRSYTGKGMGAKTCLGVELDQYVRLNTFIADLIETIDFDDFDEDCREEIVEAIRSMRTDAMGKGSIVYFPTLSYECNDPANVLYRKNHGDIK